MTKLPPSVQSHLKQDILEIVSKHLNVQNYKIFFFGSRVSDEKGDEHSDIDIGVEGKFPIPLHLLHEIKTDLENLKTLYKIDLVDFKQTSPEFKEMALEKIEWIHRPNPQK